MRVYGLVIVAAFCGMSLAVHAQEASTNTCPAPQNTIDCTPTRDCSLQSHDERNCSACILRNPFGGCLVRGNDPACEAAKASQNQIYLAQKAACEAQKAAEKASCEAAKAAVEARIAECAKQ